MSFYQPFVSARLTEPDPTALLAQLKTMDATAGVQHDVGPNYIIKKATVWTQPQINAVQNVIDTALAVSPETIAQGIIDNMPLFEKALLLTIIDQLNTIRAALPVPLPAITPAVAIAAVRTKAGTL